MLRIPQLLPQFKSRIAPKGEAKNDICKAFKISPPAEGLVEDFFFIAWTTTPWTLPSNTALTVGPKIDYVLVKTFNHITFDPIHVVLAKKFSGKNNLLVSFLKLKTKMTLLTFQKKIKRFLLKL